MKRETQRKENESKKELKKKKKKLCEHKIILFFIF